MIQYILFTPGYRVHPRWGQCKARPCTTLLFSVGKATQSWGRLSSFRSHLLVTSVAGVKVTTSLWSPTESRFFSLDLAQCFCC